MMTATQYYCKLYHGARIIGSCKGIRVMDISNNQDGTFTIYNADHTQWDIVTADTYITSITTS